MEVNVHTKYDIWIHRLTVRQSAAPKDLLGASFPDCGYGTQTPPIWPPLRSGPEVGTSGKLRIGDMSLGCHGGVMEMSWSSV